MAAPIVVLLIVSWGAAAFAQAPDPTRSRLGTLFTGAASTPAGRGLIPTAIAEARIALAEAVRAEQASQDLVAMQQAATGVLHAVDPALVPSGPGLGYGVRRSVADVIIHVEALRADDARGDVARASPRALTAARAAQSAVEALIGVAEQLRRATNVQDAAALARQMRILASDVLVGSDVTRTRARSAAGVSGLHGVQAGLAVLVVAREGAMPESLRDRPERRR